MPRSIASHSWLLLLLLACCLPAQADGTRTAEQLLATKPAIPWTPTTLRAANIFASHMVLQRDVDLPVWGTAPAGTRVTVTLAGQTQSAVTARNVGGEAIIEDVTFAGQTQSTVTDGRGWWMVVFKPLSLGDPLSMTITDGKSTIEFTDILVGDVWLFSGQSNMTQSVWGSDLRDDYRNMPERFDLPKLRMFRVGPHPGMEPTADLSRDQSWSASHIDTVKDMSAVAWSTCERLVKELDVPIGLLQVECGGSHIEAWLSKGTLTGFPHGKHRYERYFQKLDEQVAAFHLRLGDLKNAHEEAFQKREQEIVAAMRDGEPWPRRISEIAVPGERRPAVDPRRGRSYYTNLHNTMIAPLAPFAVRGFVWYQGEYSQDLGHRYAYYLRALAGEWRQMFGGAQLPFIVIQLHSGGSGGTLREVQAAAPRFIQHTSVVTAADLGNSLHPGEKSPLGHRTGGVILKDIYERDIPAHGPLFRELRVEGDKLRLYFDHADGLRLRDDADLRGFQIGYAVGSRVRYVDATAKIDGDTIVLYAEGVTDPAFARFAWGGAPIKDMTIENRHGQPMLPFASDLSWLKNFDELAVWEAR